MGVWKDLGRVEGCIGREKEREGFGKGAVEGERKEGKDLVRVQWEGKGRRVRIW